MGIYINVYLQPDIPQSKWEQTWLESLMLLKHFPAPLIRLEKQSIKKNKRFVYSTNILEDTNGDDEHWLICGDIITKKTGECFYLYRSIKHYNTLTKEFEGDILYASESEINYSNGNGINIFGNKTQGYPFHLAILAVGILLESRFPGKCYISGDIDKTQTEHMVAWINAIVDNPVQLPICFNSELLWKKIQNGYENQEHAIERFQSVSLLPSEEINDFLLKFADKTILMKNSSNRLAHYHSPTQRGAKIIIRNFLNNTKDIHSTINLLRDAYELRKKNNESENEFTLENLLEMLSNNYITIPLEEREPYGHIFYNDRNTLVDIDEAINKSMLDLLYNFSSFSPVDFKLHVSKNNLLKIFASYENNKTSIFKDIINKGDKSCRDLMKLMRKEIDKTNNIKNDSGINKESYGSATNEVRYNSKSFSDKYNFSRKIIEEDKYIINQVDRQKDKVIATEEDIRVFCKQLHDSLSGMDETTNEYFNDSDRNNILQKIYGANWNNQFVLTEDAWRNIDNEKDIRVLKNILLLSSAKNDTEAFGFWRSYVLEENELWKYFTDSA